MMLQRDGTERICWVTAAELARHLGLHPQTLANWRSRDQREGRDSAAPGKPVYRRFGGCVRYAVTETGNPVIAGDVKDAAKKGHQRARLMSKK
jgi:transposase-like protein